MKEIKNTLMLHLVYGVNAALITVPFAVCWYGYYASRIAAPFFKRGNWAVIALFLALYLVFAHAYDAFQLSTSRIHEMAYSQGLAAFLADAVMFAVIWLLSKEFPKVFPGLTALAAQLIFVVAWSVAAHKWYFFTFPPKASAVVCGGHPGMEELIHKYGLTKRFDIRLLVRAEECLKNLDMLNGLECVFLSGISSHDRNTILKYCVEKNISAYVTPRIGDVIMSGAKQRQMFHLPLLQVSRYCPAPGFLFFKRLLDLFISAAALIVLSPVMLAVAAAIKASDGGPVFYKQRRMTKNGKEFDILKFRSMRIDAEEDGIARLSTGDKDDRITSVGRVIRRFRLDELPQFFNIMAGSMSVVGPRPERPEIARQYMEELPEFSLRLQAKAGLTGYAQVHGKYNATPYDKLRMDLMYIAHPSLVEDLKIMLATLKVLLLPESTEGIAEGRTTAAGENHIRHLRQERKSVG